MTRRIDLSVDAGAVTVTGDALELDFDLAELVELPAAAIADAVKDSIDLQPDDRWHKTGRLREGIDADAGDVTAPGDRLQSPELAERFAAEVLTHDVLAGDHVDAALDRAADVLIGKGRRG